MRGHVRGGRGSRRVRRIFTPDVGWRQRGRVASARPTEDSFLSAHSLVGPRHPGVMLPEPLALLLGTHGVLRRGVATLNEHGATSKILPGSVHHHLVGDGRPVVVTFRAVTL